MTEEEIAVLQSLVKEQAAAIENLVAESAAKSATINGLEIQIDGLKESQEVTGNRLTAALQQVETSAAQVAQMQKANAALQAAIHAATGVIPQVGDIAGMYLDAMEAEAVKAINAVTAAMREKMKGG